MRNLVLGAAFSLMALAACSLTTGSGGDKESCTPGEACGSGSVQVCVTQDGKGACTGTRYKTGDGQSFQCNSCADCTSAAQSALTACSGGSGSGGGSGGSGSSSGGSGGGSGGGTQTTCTNGASCAGGTTMRVCTSVDAAGACTSIAYTVDSQTFTCVGCANCGAVQSEASQACASASGSGSGGSSGGGSGSGSGSSSGGGSGSSSGGTVPTYDGTTGRSCQSDTDCHSVTGPGVNKCTTSAIFSDGPLFPTPVCLMPGNCDPGSDGNLHFCDGPDDSTSPGLCVSTGAAGMGLCLPQCTFGTTGAAVSGCVGKDACSIAGIGADSSGATLGIGYCFGGCAQNSDCPSGSQCQTNDGLCMTTLTTPTAAGTSCNSTTTTGVACECFSDATSDLGFCSSTCTVGGAACASGWKCDADLPTSFTNSAGATVAGWTMQNPGLAGTCTPDCVVDGGTVCPTNSTCQSITAEGPDCIP